MAGRHRDFGDECDCISCLAEASNMSPTKEYDGKIWCTCKPGTRCEVDCLIEEEDFLNDALGG